MKDSHIFVFSLDIVGVTVQFVQRGAQWLAIINLPETDACFQASVILVINRDEFGQIETFKMVEIPEAKGNTAVFCVNSNSLHLFVKILAKFGFIGFILERHAIAKQIGNGLCCKVVVPIRCNLVIR